MREDSFYILPRKAEKKIKIAWKMKNPLYIYGISGSGKTSLVKNMFENKPYMLFSAEKCCPEEIEIKKDGKEHIIVIDDLHFVKDADERKKYEEIIYHLLERKDIMLILISRAPVPGWLMSLYVQYDFVTVDEEELCFTRKEQMEYLEKRKVFVGKAEEDTMWEFAGGIPVVVRILAMYDGNIEETKKAIYNFADSHVYDKWEPELQTILMETSIVEQFTKELAEMITGNSHIAEFLEQAQELGNFFSCTGEEGVWKYRWQMRKSMLWRLRKKYTDKKIKNLYHHAGLYYEIRDMIPEALEMYEQCQDKESISRVLVANVRKNPATGYYFEMRKYYLVLSEEMIKESPVLMAGMSMLQSMLMNEEESERWYRAIEEYAASHTGCEKREAKNRLLYLDIGLPHRGSVNLTEILKHAGTLLRERGASLPEFSVTSNLPSLMNGGKDFCEWSKRDKELAASIGKIVEFVLGKYGKGLVPLALAESFLEKGRDSYEIMSLAEKGKLAAESGGKVEQCFVAIGILSWLFILNGKPDYAIEQLEIFRERALQEAKNLLPNIDAFICRIQLYLGGSSEIEQWMKEAPQEAAEFATMDRFRYLTKARVYLQRGKNDLACGILEQLLYYAKKMSRTYIKIEAGILLAIAMNRLERTEWKTVFQNCITQAEEYHFVRLFSREGTAVCKLFQSQEFVWKDEKFKEQVLSECEKMGKLYPRYLEPGTGGEIQLSENALKILQMQADGILMKNIAKKLGIKETTVKYHSSETYKKLGVRSKVEAVNEARRRKLI